MSISALSENASLRPLSSLPMPRGLPILGHLTRIEPLRVHQQLEEWARELGTPFRLKFLNENVVVFDDIEAGRRIMRDRPGAFTRGRRIRPVSAELGFEGVFSSEGEAWAAQRKLTSEALHPNQVRQFHPVMAGITDRLYGRWRRAAEGNDVVEMMDDLMRYTVDVTSALAFGEDPNTVENDDDRIQKHLATIFPMFMKRIMTPLSYWHWLKLPADRRLDRSMAAVHAYVGDLIDRTRGRLKSRDPDQPGTNLLEAFLKLKDAPGSDMKNVDIAANVLTMLLAGEDTTAHSLAWTMLYLAKDEELQERLHDEARSAFGDDASCHDPEAMRKLDLAEACVMEALRLRPVVPFNSFVSLEGTVIQDIEIPADTMLFFINRPSLTDAGRFSEPGRYRPERWLGEAGARFDGRHDARAFLLFGAGPRVCPGRHLATQEMRLVVSMLARSFYIELAADPTEIREVQAFTMGPSKMPVRLRLRPDAAASRPAPAVGAGTARCPFGKG
jgi:cytochrome P450